MHWNIGSYSDLILRTLKMVPKTIPPSVVSRNIPKWPWYLFGHIRIVTERHWTAVIYSIPVNQSAGQESCHIYWALLIFRSVGSRFRHASKTKSMIEQRLSHSTLCITEVSQGEKFGSQHIFIFFLLIIFNRQDTLKTASF